MAPRAARPVVAALQAACKAAALPAVPEQMPVACRAAAQMAAAVHLVVPELTPAARKADPAEAVRKAVDQPAVPRVAVECKAAVLTAAALLVERAQMVAAPRVVAAGIRRPGAEPLAVAAARKAVAPRVHKAAVAVVVAAR